MSKSPKSQKDQTEYAIDYDILSMNEVGKWWQPKQDNFTSLKEAKKEASKRLPTQNASRT
jgi:hypothetical protein